MLEDEGDFLSGDMICSFSQMRRGKLGISLRVGAQVLSLLHIHHKLLIGVYKCAHRVTVGHQRAGW